MVPEQPTVSILIPTLNEEFHIGAVLNAASSQTYPSVLIEVIVADGGSTDGTREVFSRFSGVIQSLRWVDNPMRHQAVGLNLAAAEASGDVLVRWDAHAVYSDTYVEAAVVALSDDDVSVVGAQWTPEGDSWFSDAVAGAMMSRIAIGNDRFVESDGPHVVDTAMCGVMTRLTFESVQGFDEAFWPAGEDADLNFRIRRAGGKIVLDPAMVARYYPRDRPGALVKQYYGYGVAKAALLLKHGVFPSLRPLAPVGLVAAPLMLLLTPRPAWSMAVLLGVYALFLAVGSLIWVPGSARRRLSAALLTPLMHLPYGVGVWIGVIRSLSTRIRTRTTPRDGRGGA